MFRSSTKSAWVSYPRSFERSDRSEAICAAIALLSYSLPLLPMFV
jgi:hypothetical protein